MSSNTNQPSGTPIFTNDTKTLSHITTLKPFEVFGFFNNASWDPNLNFFFVFENPNLDWNFNGITHCPGFIGECRFGSSDRVLDFIRLTHEENWDWYNMNYDAYNLLRNHDPVLFEKYRDRMVVSHKLDIVRNNWVQMKHTDNGGIDVMATAVNMTVINDGWPKVPV